MKNLQESDVARSYLDAYPASEKFCNDLVLLAAHTCQTKFAALSFMDHGRERLKATRGFKLLDIDARSSFLAHMGQAPSLMIIEDALADLRFSQNPLVVRVPEIRFLAGAPILAPTGLVVGGLFVMADAPRQLAFVKQQALRILAASAAAKLELERSRHVGPVSAEPGEPALIDVLLVEDSAISAKVVSKQLRECGCTVHRVANGTEALAACEEGSFDLILMDCQMEGLDGYETTRRIRSLEKLHTRTPVSILAISASDNAEEHSVCLQCGMNGFIKKPVSLDNLRVAVERWRR